MKDLLIKLKEVYDSGYSSYLCFCAGRMLYDLETSLEEYALLMNYLKNNEPKGGWYPMRNRESRIKWLNEHIKLNS